MIPARLFEKQFRLQRLFAFLARLPRPVAYRLATHLGGADAKHRAGAMAGELAAVEHGMSLLLRESELDPARRAAHLRAYAQLMARDKLDCYFMPRFRREGCKSLIALEGAQHLAAARDAGRGVVLIISHFGRFFMLGPGLGMNGFPFAMLTTAVDETNQGYDAVDLAYMKIKITNTQFYSRDEWITTAHDYRRVYRALGKGRVVLIAMDGLETNSTQQMQFPFFGGTLRLPSGLVRIAERTGARLVYAAVREARRGWGVTIEIHPLARDPAAALAGSVAILERDVRRTPSHWWQWPLVPVFWQPDAQPSCT